MPWQHLEGQLFQLWPQAVWPGSTSCWDTQIFSIYGEVLWAQAVWPGSTSCQDTQIFSIYGEALRAWAVWPGSTSCWDTQVFSIFDEALRARAVWPGSTSWCACFANLLRDGYLLLLCSLMIQYRRASAVSQIKHWTLLECSTYLFGCRAPTFIANSYERLCPIWPGINHCQGRGISWWSSDCSKAVGRAEVFLWWTKLAMMKGWSKTDTYLSMQGYILRQFSCGSKCYPEKHTLGRRVISIQYVLNIWLLFLYCSPTHPPTSSPLHQKYLPHTPPGNRAIRIESLGIGLDDIRLSLYIHDGMTSQFATYV